MEIIVVTSIVVLLVGGAIGSYELMMKRAKDRVQTKNIRLIREAIYEYYLDNGAYPDSLDILTPAGGPGKGYLRTVPVNPYTNQADWIIINPPSETTKVFDISAP
jgi:general secretion pathway protein G